MSKNDHVIVSIVMPTFNRADRIGNAVESVLKQNFNDWELLVIDNQSTDNTREVIDSFCRKDCRIKYHNVKKSSHPGLSDYLNYGLNIAIGEYIGRIDDDDEWLDPDKLTKQVDFLNNNKEYIVVGGGAIMVDSDKKELYRFFKRETDSEIRRNALYANPFCHSTVLFRKKETQVVGGYKELRFGEDWDLWLRLGRTGKFYNFKEYFILYLNAGISFSSENQKYLSKTILTIIKENKDYYPNFIRAYILNFLQYLYSFVPSFIKNRTQIFLIYIKRNYF